MSTPTALFGVLRGLEARLTASLTTPVYLGPPPPGEPLDAAVVIGWDLVSEDGRSGDTQQRYRELGVGAARDDTGRVTGVVLVQSGDATFDVLLARAEAIMQAIQDVIRADPTLGLPYVVRAELDSAEVFMGDAEMFAVRVPWRLSFAAIV